MKDGRKLILIADDEREIRDVVSLLMRGEGYEVILAEDGEDVMGKMSPERAITPFCVFSFSLLFRRFSSSFGAFISITMPIMNIGINKSPINSHAPG